MGLRLLFVAALVVGSHAILVRTRPSKIAVLNYHSISSDPTWLRIGDKLSLSPEAFERQLAYLSRRGYRTLFISELHQMLAGKKEFERGRRYVALTFDDGYADNWVAAFPLLREYGMKATLFISTDFIDPADRTRPRFEHAKDSRSELEWEGYLTWPELRQMHASGLIEIQSHGTQHARVFCRDKLISFVSPRRINLWLFWEERPKSRTRWWLDLPGDTSLLGHPLFPQKSALAARAYRPDPDAVAYLRQWAVRRGEPFFRSNDWEDQLRREWKTFLDEHGDHSVWESEDAYAVRVKEELSRSRWLLEERLGVPARFLCWPENEFSPLSERLAREVGFTATVSNDHNTSNVVGKVPGRISRVWVGQRGCAVAQKHCEFVDFVARLRVFEGCCIWYPVRVAISVFTLLSRALRRRFSCSVGSSSNWE